MTTEKRIVRCKMCGFIFPLASAEKEVPLGHGQPDYFLVCPYDDECGAMVGYQDKGVRYIGDDGEDVTSEVTKPCENCGEGVLHWGYFKSHDGTLELEGAVCAKCYIFEPAPSADDSGGSP